MLKTTLEIANTTCAPLGNEVNPDLRDMLLEPALREELIEIADEAEAQHVTQYDDLETGQAARRALEVGCAACMLSDVCIVKDRLEQKVVAGQEHERFMNAATMLASAPKWLNAARIHRSGVDGVSMLTRLMSSDKAEQAYAAGELPLDELIGETANHVSAEVTKKDVPILATTRRIEPDDTFTVHNIETPAATYDVIDASEVLNFKGEPLDPKEYGNLTSKLLNRMEEVNANGQPQVFTAENTMQKVITKRDNATLFEMRMAGKNRLYFWASQPEGANPQIIILGSHSGDRATQQAFIDSYTA